MFMATLDVSKCFHCVLARWWPPCKMPRHHWSLAEFWDKRRLKITVATIYKSFFSLYRVSWREQQREPEQDHYLKHSSIVSVK